MKLTAAQLLILKELNDPEAMIAFRSLSDDVYYYLSKSGRKVTRSVDRLKKLGLITLVHLGWEGHHYVISEKGKQLAKECV